MTYENEVHTTSQLKITMSGHMKFEKILHLAMHILLDLLIQSNFSLMLWKTFRTTLVRFGILY